MITGTAQGLGAQFARKLAKLGNIIHCVDIDEALNERMVSELTSAGHSAYAYKGDVTSWESLCSLKECIAKNGGDFVSYVINNAGIGEAGYLTEKSPKEIELTVKVRVINFDRRMRKFLVCTNVFTVINSSGELAGPYVSHQAISA